MITIEQYLLLFILWVCWCGLHSILISVSITQFFERLLGNKFRFFRIGYNLVSSVTLAVPVLVSMSFQKSEKIALVWPVYFAPLRFCLIFSALLLFWYGSKQYDMKHFLGISQIRTDRNDQLLGGKSEFSASGVSSVIRHPWYLGGMILVWSLPGSFYPSTMITAFVVSVYFLVGSILEERKLVSCFGESYRVYQRNVSMLFPTKWLNRLILKNTRGE